MKRRTLVVLMMVVMLIGFAYLGYVRDQPFLAVAISSHSMEPVMHRGDVVFIRPMRKSTELSVNQIILFKAEEKGINQWTMHRIVDGSSDEGFITRGDSNWDVDQRCLGFPPIKSQWIGGFVPQIGSRLLIIPKLGYVTLWLDENLRTTPFLTGLIINLVLLSVMVLGVATARNAGRYVRNRAGNGLTRLR